ncbi:ethanolamine ammonia-lyase subunit EutC [Catalinimonas niigatensis]|uniref:ethanolamine ammonia-lyase subunit EutC n=1 Tax=Catalinimonas niigatensis TaxID=1397264 RepID=UPI00266615B7|nr:ethanolamine ammonia-lyase subunit EutC [Catalinimonas niigatensis]WPP50678.1 ethanolamine ammonia-lyase subunit EutC [Catalinimonas niigatensis]
MDKKSTYAEDFWQELRRHTSARIALGRAGSSMTTHELLNFQQAHALARDAVHTPLNEALVSNALRDLNLPFILLQTKATDRQSYLLRPDWGKILAEESAKAISETQSEFDIALIVADGLSAQAIHQHIASLFGLLIQKLLALNFSLAPVAIVRNGRVAVSDEIGQALKSKVAIIFIGERPGLSSPDSLGVYLTYAPSKGNTDEKRNCISNIRPEGMPYVMAAEKITYLIQEAMRRQISGVTLKDDLQISLEG